MHNVMACVIEEEVVKRAAAQLGPASGPAKALELARGVRARGLDPVFLKQGDKLFVMSEGEMDAMFPGGWRRALTFQQAADLAQLVNPSKGN